ncbi:hypothetical protein ACFU8W_52390 [Streptomyces sp. NPDC057565]|uniref:hypothetical protein n=1 Tax=Streptomyces sp. NPDC057565 TaxID=3346169 RepID=UPI003698EAB9
MFQETPIYTRLVAEQGDVPAQVRGEAQRVLRDLERVMPPGRRLPSLCSRRPALPSGQAT